MANENHIQKDKQNHKAEIKQFREFLGLISARYTDAQLIQLRSDMHAAARLLLDLYLEKKDSGGQDDIFDNSGAGA